MTSINCIRKLKLKVSGKKMTSLMRTNILITWRVHLEGQVKVNECRVSIL